MSLRMSMIRQFYPEEWPVYKGLRLAALTEAPNAFGSTVAAESGRSDADWQDFLNQGINCSNSMPLLALHNGKAAGLAWGKMDSLSSNPSPNISQETAYLYRMWVHPDYRGLGIARQLMAAFKTWAISCGATVLALDVAIDNSGAYHLYRAFGFNDAGQPTPLRQGSQLQVQPMVCQLA